MLHFRGIFVVLVALAKPLGGYMAAVYEGERTVLSPFSGRSERLIYRLAGVGRDAEIDWKRYAFGDAAVQSARFLVVYLLQRAAGVLPLNPQELAAVTPDSSFNTAVSFATNTNWQGYGGEATMSYLTQMLGLSVQNFVSAATGMAVLVALIRGLARAQTGRRSATSGSISRARRCTSCCRCRWCWRWCWCRRASCRTSTPTRRSRWSIRS